MNQSLKKSICSRVEHIWLKSHWCLSVEIIYQNCSQDVTYPRSSSVRVRHLSQFRLDIIIVLVLVAQETPQWILCISGWSQSSPVTRRRVDMRHGRRNVQLSPVLWSSINRARLITSIGLSDNAGLNVEKGATMWHMRAVGFRGTDLGTEQVFHMKALWTLTDMEIPLMCVWWGLNSKAGLTCWDESFVFPLSDHIC